MVCGKFYGLCHSIIFVEADLYFAVRGKSKQFYQGPASITMKTAAICLSLAGAAAAFAPAPTQVCLHFGWDGSSVAGADFRVVL